MEDALAKLLERFGAEDPTLTHEELERQIAHTMGERINAAVRDVTENEDLVSFLQTMQEKFGLLCEITPTLSLYVNINDEHDQQDRAPSFSSLPLEESLNAINAQSIPPEKVIALTEQAINQSCDYFLNAVILSNPLLMKIFKRLQDEFGKSLAIAIKMPVSILSVSTEDIHNKNISDGRPGMYL